MPEDDVGESISYLSDILLGYFRVPDVNYLKFLEAEQGGYVLDGVTPQVDFLEFNLENDLAMVVRCKQRKRMQEGLVRLIESAESVHKFTL